MPTGVYKRPPLEVRFWPNVDKRGPDECWPWKAGVGGDGYGRVRNGSKQDSAHRVSWELNNGPIPDGLHVLHKCDNRPCVNPAHLFLGTHQDNMADMVKKERTTRKTHCKRGHPLSGDNLLYVNKQGRRGRFNAFRKAYETRRTAARRMATKKRREQRKGVTNPINKRTGVADKCERCANTYTTPEIREGY